MAKDKISADHSHVPVREAKSSKRRTKLPTESSLLRMRIKELDREFARQTKQLTALTKKLGKKIALIAPGENPDDSAN